MNDLPSLISTILWFVAFGILGVIAIYMMNGGHKAARPVAPETVPQMPARTEPPALQYERAAALLTLAERAFLQVLHEVIPPGTIVALKVRLADIVEPKQVAGIEWQKAAENVNNKHADFTLCDSETYEILAVLELDGPAQGRPDRIETDEFLEGALSSVGIPVIRVLVQANYDIEALQSAIARCVPKYFENLAAGAPA